MRKTLTILGCLAAIPAGAALADDDSLVPMTDWQPRQAVARLAEQNGWTVRRIETDDGCYEIDGRDREGREIEVTVHPATFQVIELEREDDDDEARSPARQGPDGDGSPGGGPSPAGSATPPQNGLFGTGAPPQVRVN
jgi:hypothetical protein